MCVACVWAGQARPCLGGLVGMAHPAGCQGNGVCPGPQSRLYLNPVNWLRMRYFQNNLHCSFSFLELPMAAKMNSVNRSKMFSYLGNQLSEAERTDWARGRVSRPSPNSPHQLNDHEHGPWPLWASQIPRPWANALSASSWLLFLLYEARHTCNWRALLLAYQDRS